MGLTPKIPYVEISPDNHRKLSERCERNLRYADTEESRAETSTRVRRTAPESLVEKSRDQSSASRNSSGHLGSTTCSSSDRIAAKGASYRQGNPPGSTQERP